MSEATTVMENDSDTAYRRAEEALEKFDQAIAAHDYLEMDGVVEADNSAVGTDGEATGSTIANTLRPPYLKILNHNRRVAYGVEVSAIINQDISQIIDSLESGITRKLYGITRIVGYYSRVHNWNKSKLGELRDRHRGNYSVTQCSK